MGRRGGSGPHRYRDRAALDRSGVMLVVMRVTMRVTMRVV